MKKYWYLVKLSWQSVLTYRLDFLLRILGGFFMMAVTIALWVAIYDQSSLTEIKGYTLTQMVIYLLGAGLINSFIMITHQGDEVNDEINYGILSTYLIKPFNVQLFWFIRDLASRVLLFIQGGIIIFFIIIITSFFIDLSFLLVNILFFLISIIIAIILHYFLFYIFTIIAFWLEQTWGPRFVIRVFMNIATGRLIPLSLFPIFWYQLLNVLPFKFMGFIPMEILLNRLTISQTFIQLGIGLIWIIIFASMGFLLYKIGVKKYAAEGI